MLKVNTLNVCINKSTNANLNTKNVYQKLYLTKQDLQPVEF